MRKAAGGIGKKKKKSRRGTVDCYRGLDLGLREKGKGKEKKNDC